MDFIHIFRPPARPGDPILLLLHGTGGNEEDLVRYGHVPQGRGPVTLYRGAGCPTCNFTGMKGRVAIYEVMPISETIRDMILEDASTAVLR